MDAGTAYAGGSALTDIIGGLFGYLSAEAGAATAESRGRMLRLEAETDATLYAEQARGFKASQKLSYLKSGVTLSGSPLDILAETARVASENISAIQARGAAQQLDADNQGEAIRSSGRMALLKGITGAAGTAMKAAYFSSKTGGLSSQNQKNTGFNTRGEFMSAGYDGP